MGRKVIVEDDDKGTDMIIWLSLEGFPFQLSKPLKIKTHYHHHHPGPSCSPFITPDQLSSSLLYSSGEYSRYSKENTLKCTMDSFQLYFPQSYVAPDRILWTIEKSLLIGKETLSIASIKVLYNQSIMKAHLPTIPSCGCRHLRLILHPHYRSKYSSSRGFKCY